MATATPEPKAGPSNLTHNDTGSTLEALKGPSQHNPLAGFGNPAELSDLIIKATEVLATKMPSMRPDHAMALVFFEFIGEFATKVLPTLIRSNRGPAELQALVRAAKGVHQQVADALYSEGKMSPEGYEMCNNALKEMDTSLVALVGGEEKTGTKGNTDKVGEQGKQPSFSESKDGSPFIKLGYGKIKHDPLPDNLEEYNIKPVFEEIRDEESQANKFIFRMTCVPQMFDDRLDKDGHCIWITTTSIKTRFFNSPGFPKPVAKVGTSKVIVKQAPDGMGLGVFARADIKRFEIVIAERPYLVYPLGVHTPNEMMEKGKALTANQLSQIILMKEEEKYRVVVDRMTTEDRIGFMKLANSHREDGSGPIHGIIRTNGFRVAFGDPETDDPDPRLGYGAVARIGSRFNHSCIPDVASRFDSGSFSIQFVATRDIKAGSQIFACYVSHGLTKAERQAELAPYGVSQCICRACVNATPQSDKLRKVSGKLIDTWTKQVDRVWLKDPKLTVRVLDPLLATKKKMEEEGLDEGGSYYTLYIIMYRVYSALGMKKEAEESWKMLDAAGRSLEPIPLGA